MKIIVFGELGIFLRLECCGMVLQVVFHPRYLKTEGSQPSVGRSPKDLRFLWLGLRWGFVQIGVLEKVLQLRCPARKGLASLVSEESQGCHGMVLKLKWLVIEEECLAMH